MKTIDFANPSARLGRGLAVSLTYGDFTHGAHVPLSAIHFPRSAVTKRAAERTD